MNLTMKFLQFALFSIFLLHSFSGAFSQATVKINLTFSKYYATYAYLQDLSEYVGDNEYKRAYKASEFYNDENNGLIFQMDTLSIDYSYAFHDFPKGDKLLGMTGSILRKNLVNCKSLEEFKARSFGVIPSEELSLFTGILEHFIPIYDALVFEANRNDFELKMKGLKTYVDSINISTFFEKSLSFYGTKWDPTIPFDIVIVPSTKKGGFTAQAFMNVAVSEVPLDFPHYDILFAVLLHEIDHILYDEQSLQLKQNLNTWFDENPSGNRRYAYLLMNEVLATALGNGYVYEVINGSVDTEDWYNVKYINLMAKQVYPLVKEYLNAEKPMDKAFVDRYIAMYDAHFSEWTNELENLFTYRYIVTDYESIDDFFRVNYPYASQRYIEIPLSKEALEKMMETPVTKMVIVTENHKEDLTLLRKVIPELAKWKFNAKKEFIKVIDLADGTKLFVLNCHSDVEALLTRYFANGSVPQ